MSSEITKKELEHLAELAHVELSEKEKSKLIKDLGKILEYFEELREVKTDGVDLTATGGVLKNAFREDKSRENTNIGMGPELFPENKDGFLVIPPVFE